VCLVPGASRRVITMEWDKFWSDNKKYLEESAFRYMSVGCDTAVPFAVTNIPDGEIAAVVPLHPQKPELGTRVMRRSNSLLVERDDCAPLKVGEEVTLLRWGNFFIDEIVRDANNVVTSMKVGTILSLLLVDGRAHTEHIGPLQRGSNKFCEDKKSNVASQYGK
jgi:glutamyl-tRNA synthetase